MKSNLLKNSITVIYGPLIISSACACGDGGETVLAFVLSHFTLFIYYVDKKIST